MNSKCVQWFSSAQAPEKPMMVEMAPRQGSRHIFSIIFPFLAQAPEFQADFTFSICILQMSFWPELNWGNADSTKLLRQENCSSTTTPRTPCAAPMVGVIERFQSQSYSPNSVHNKGFLQQVLKAGVRSGCSIHFAFLTLLKRWQAWVK